MMLKALNMFKKMVEGTKCSKTSVKLKQSTQILKQWLSLSW